MTAIKEASRRTFQFDRDTFAYPHELAWKYHFDPVTGAMTTYKADPPPTYYHRCFLMARTVRQFFDHARFEPEAPAVDKETYRKLIRAVIARNPRRVSAGSDRIVIPGYDDLRSFSRAHEDLLKAECGQPWESYLMLSHWRMIFPVWGWHQEKMSQKLMRSLRERGQCVVHLFCFPRTTINHGIVLFGFAESGESNIPNHPVTLVFNRKLRRFTFAPNIYWGGGVLSVMEIYCDSPSPF
jgi:hypothetical protein